MKREARYVLLLVALGAALGCTICTAQPRIAAESSPVTQLRYVTMLVKDYEEALAWYTGVLGLKKVEDRKYGPGRRWVVVAPEGRDQPGIVLEVPSSLARVDRIGKETNWVFAVADCAKFYDTLRARGVHFTQPPTRQPWGTTQAVFEDPYGNIFVAESRENVGAERHPGGK